LHVLMGVNINTTFSWDFCLLTRSGSRQHDYTCCYG
jgi:hypothetical protein